MSEIIGLAVILICVANGIANGRQKSRERALGKKPRRVEEPLEEIEPLSATDLKVMDRWFSGKSE